MAIPNPLQAAGQRLSNVSGILQATDANLKGKKLRDLQRKAAEEQAEQQLAKLQDPARQEAEKSKEQQDVDVLRIQSNAVMNRFAQDTMRQAFSAYSASGESRFLNQMLSDLKDNPVGAEKFKNTVRIDNFTVSNLADDALLRSIGIENTEGFYENQKQLTNIVKVTGADGKIVATDMNGFYAANDFLRYQQTEDLKVLQQRASLLNSLREPGGTAGTSLERQAQRLQDAGDPREVVEIITELEEKKARTSIDKRLTRVEEAEEELNDRFGGLEGFLALDLSTLSSEDQDFVNKQIRAIEKQGGLEISDSVQKDLSAMAQLIAVAEPAAEITDRETGLIDSFMRGIEKKVSDSAQGLDSSSAYAAFRNSVRHALFGSAVTAAEITSFNQAFGTLGDQLGPVLIQFKTGLNQVKAKLESIQRFADPRVAKFRLGISSDQINTIIDRLDERLELIDKVGKSGTQEPSFGQHVLEAGKTFFGIDTPAEDITQDAVNDIFGGGGF